MNDKRSGIKKIIGTGAIVGFWPRSWVKPIVSSVILPAHANTSTSPTCNTVEDIAGGFMSVAITDSGGAQTLLLEPIGTPNILQYVFTGNSFDIDSTEQFTLLSRP